MEPRPARNAIGSRPASVRPWPYPPWPDSPGGRCAPGPARPSPAGCLLPTLPVRCPQPSAPPLLYAHLPGRRPTIPDPGSECTPRYQRPPEARSTRARQTSRGSSCAAAPSGTKLPTLTTRLPRLPWNSRPLLILDIARRWPDSLGVKRLHLPNGPRQVRARLVIAIERRDLVVVVAGQFILGRDDFDIVGHTGLEPVARLFHFLLRQLRAQIRHIHFTARRFDLRQGGFHFQRDPVARFPLLLAQLADGEIGLGAFGSDAAPCKHGNLHT